MSLSVALTLDRPTRRIELELEIRPGETVALLGPNGAGKSSILAAIAGLLRPTTGHVRLFDDVLFDAARGVDVAPGDRGLGLLQQRANLFPHLDVLHNVAFGLHDSIWGAPAEALARARAALDAHGIGELAARAPASLSGGEAQKVALVRMLARAPRAWLLDEPLTSLDLVARRDVRSLLRGLQSRDGQRAAKTPWLVVVHEPHDALVLASRWVVIDEGRVVAHGPPHALETLRASSYVDALREDVRSRLANDEDLRDDPSASVGKTLVPASNPDADPP